MTPHRHMPVENAGAVHTLVPKMAAPDKNHRYVVFVSSRDDFVIAN